mmetsp:Transcript_19764/g.46332  ORF Transcript_19764/g.46332 Transcript_19764/m.46332 type:complete len:82 (-) Transcript_19764:108-353(-)
MRQPTRKSGKLVPGSAKRKRNRACSQVQSSPPMAVAKHRQHGEQCHLQQEQTCCDGLATPKRRSTSGILWTSVSLLDALRG